MIFRSYDGQFDHRALGWARLVHGRVFGPMPLSWARRGTWIEAWHGPRRIAFAPHRGGSSIYFPGPGPVASYRNLGDRCPVGKVSIKIPAGSDFEAGLIAAVVAEHLGMSGGPTVPARTDRPAEAIERA